jgi:tRNA nucleotidyltransferase (CCA-adding enzyme)
MKIAEILKLIHDIAANKNLSEPFICGGLPRDKVLGKLSEIKDIDITNGDQSIHKLALETAKVLYKKGAEYKISKDGHAQIIFNKIKYDFSSNFIVPNIKSLLLKSGLKNPTDMQMELYSRDFTVNALLMTMDLKTIKDPLGLGIKDCKNKLIRTCFPPEITLKNDPKRIPRAIYLSSKLGFKLDDEIIDWIKLNKHILSEVDNNYITEKINSALSYNEENTINLLNELDLWNNIPSNALLSDIIRSKGLL